MGSMKMGSTSDNGVQLGIISDTRFMLLEDPDSPSANTTV